MNTEFYKIYRNMAFITMVFTFLTGGAIYYRTNDFGVVIASLIAIGLCSLAAFLFQTLHDLNSEEFDDEEDDFEDDDDNEFDDHDL